MGRDLYTNGEIVVATTAVEAILAAVGCLTDTQDPITTIEDLADHLYELAAGSPYDDDLTLNHDGVSVDAGDTDTVIGITVNNGRMQIDQWQTIMSVLAEHGATGSFFHEEEDGTHGDQYRSRLDDGNAYSEPRLDYIFKNDTIAYLGHMQRAPDRAWTSSPSKPTSAMSSQLCWTNCAPAMPLPSPLPAQVTSNNSLTGPATRESTGRSIRSPHRNPRYHDHRPR
ncbi:hypothetical protein [Nocardia miyunensis]|uniref:hypothetical protein n=1 Tax=Nocardia miyunensis TaxID=282684 RepID=UPI00082B024B|nr:hypothetical protein [Nocardia miyunensis]